MDKFVVVLIAILAAICAGVSGDGRCAQRVSFTGADDANALLQTFNPSIAWNSERNEFLVVYHADQENQDAAFEVYGRRLSSSGSPLGSEFQVSSTGDDDADSQYSAQASKVAYNSVSDEYLVVWQADEQGLDNAFDIYGQRISGTGALVGETSFRISSMGAAPSDVNYRAQDVALAFNPDANQFLVVWSGDAQGMDGAFEIYGQLLQGNTEVGDDFRISVMGPNGSEDDPLYGAIMPTVTYNPDTSQFLVCWQGEHLIHHAWEVYCQALNGETGALEGGATEISNMGTDPSSTSYRAYQPKVVYNPDAAEYLVIWYGDDDRTAATGAMEVYGQRLDGVTLNEVGLDDYLISSHGDNDLSPLYDGQKANIAYSSSAQEYMVVVEGDVQGFDDAYEIWAYRLDGNHGGPLNTDPIRVTYQGDDDVDVNYEALDPAIAYSATSNKFVTVYRADRENQDDAYEIYASSLAPSGELMCASGSSSSSGSAAAVAIIVTLIVVIAIVGCVVYVVRKRDKKNSKEGVARTTGTKPGAHHISSDEVSLDDAHARSKAKAKAKSGRNQKKVSRKRKSRSTRKAAAEAELARARRAARQSKKKTDQEAVRRAEQDVEDLPDYTYDFYYTYTSQSQGEDAQDGLVENDSFSGSSFEDGRV